MLTNRELKKALSALTEMELDMPATVWDVSNGKHNFILGMGKADLFTDTLPILEVNAGRNEISSALELAYDREASEELFFKSSVRLDNQVTYSIDRAENASNFKLGSNHNQYLQTCLGIEPHAEGMISPVDLLCKINELRKGIDNDRDLLANHYWPSPEVSEQLNNLYVVSTCIDRLTEIANIALEDDSAVVWSCLEGQGIRD